jgi:predicted DNA-binding transcriptional regulator AlpA
MKKTDTSAEKPASKAKTKTKDTSVVPAEKPVAVVKETKPKQPNPEAKTPKKPKAEVSKLVVASPEIDMPERVGLTAGSIWRYLDENGASSVAKLIKDLPEEEKIIQRSIGWLAQEGKITLEIIDRVETIALKS